MKRGLIGSDTGFTYIAVLVMVVVIGIMLAAASQTWTTVMKREREKELLFRGMQIRNAIEQWWKPRPGAPPPRPISDLKDLLQNPYSLQKIRYLRRLYRDPITGKDWVLIKDPVRGIIGVASSSGETPFKQGGFSDELKDFEGKNKYSDWQFVYRPGGAPGSQPAGAPVTPASRATVTMP